MQMRRILGGFCCLGLAGAVGFALVGRLGGPLAKVEIGQPSASGQASGVAPDAGEGGALPCLLDTAPTLAAADTFRIVADLDGDAVADTFGYTRGRPWHTVHAWFSRRDTSWTAQPGAGLQEVFAGWNLEIKAWAESQHPDSAEARKAYERHRIHPDNVEHAPVMAFGGRLVVMWFMEPLYPAGINSYDACGQVLSRYVHPGHLRALLPVSYRGRRWVVFGGTNNVLDGEAAKREQRRQLNLPVVGMVPLGADGVHHGLRPHVMPEAKFITLDLPYKVVDWERNSQVVFLRLSESGLVEGIYEPGSTRRKGKAEQPGRFSISLDSLAAARDTLAP